MANTIYPNRSGESNPNFRGGKLLPCYQCGADVRVRPSRLAANKYHFCGFSCRNAWLSTVRGKNSSNFKGGPIEKVCPVCGIKFHVARGEHTRGRGKYCSRRCLYSARDLTVERACVVCGFKRFVSPHKVGTAKFCSQRCKRASQVKRRTPREIAQRKLEVRIASLMGYSLKGRKAGCRWESLVGYTLADLMKHLESLFWPGMSWHNIGDWHVDHCRPRSSFTYDSPADPEFKACWALENLQPLWAVDNMRKGARLDWKPLAA